MRAATAATAAAAAIPPQTRKIDTSMAQPDRQRVRSALRETRTLTMLYWIQIAVGCVARRRAIILLLVVCLRVRVYAQHVCARVLCTHVCTDKCEERERARARGSFVYGVRALAERHRHDISS